MKKFSILTIFVLLFSVLTSCIGNAPTSSPTLDTNLIATFVAATVSALPSVTPLPTLTPIPSSTPSPSETLTPLTPTSLPDGWVTYTNSQYGFSFAHPNLFNCQQSCGASFYDCSDPESVVNFAVERTLVWGTDAPFDGFSVEVCSNNENLTINEYVGRIKQYLPEHPRYGDSPIIETHLSVGDQPGIMLSPEGHPDNIAGLYVRFPNDNRILVITRVEQNVGSFETVFEQILSTFIFGK